ncbi:MAG TPA: zf-HC2 domain-containing protein [Candidatus Eisenbacteria bacterium]
MSDRFTDLLSDYVDGELDRPIRRDLEEHLAACAECAAFVEDLRLVVAKARALPAIEPETDLWPGIEARLGPPSRPEVGARRAGWSERHVTFSLPQLAAACLAIAIVSGGAVWYARTTGLRQAAMTARGPGRAAEPLSTALAARSTAPSPTLPIATASGQVGEGVEELRRILAGARDQLDPSTVRTLEESLNVIDVAIHEARRALDADPHNPYVRAHLDDTVRRRVELLNRATVLASAPR